MIFLLKVVIIHAYTMDKSTNTIAMSRTILREKLEKVLAEASAEASAKRNELDEAQERLESIPPGAVRLRGEAQFDEDKFVEFDKAEDEYFKAEDEYLKAAEAEDEARAQLDKVMDLLEILENLEGEPLV